MSRPLGKSFKNKKDEHIFLGEHTNDVLSAFKNILLKLPQDIKSKVKELKTQIKLAIFCHDFGKILPAFQIKVLNNKDYQPFYPYDEIPHSIFSLFFINKEELERRVKPDIYVNIILSSIAFHHWRDSYDEILNYSTQEIKNLCKKMLEDKSFRQELEYKLKNELKHKDFEEVIKFNSDLAKGLFSGLALKDFVVPPYGNNYLPLREFLAEKFKKHWIFIAGFLMRCDHFASFCEEEGTSLEKIEIPNINYEKIKTKIKDKIKQLGKSKIWQIDTLKAEGNGNFILIAPTGSGKTEFAYLWGAGNKIFFTLPFRSAVNAMYERAKWLFGEENVGLLHSDADIYLYGSSIKYESEVLKVLEMARQLSLPVLVFTGDQVFPTALRYPGYEKIYATLAYSKIVIDEVQAYDPRAVAIIIKLIEDVVRLGGKFLLMTATLPTFVIHEIEDRVGNSFKVIDKYEDYSQIVKHVIELREGDITENIVEILKKANEGKRVLIILNTVAKAQEVYTEIKNRMKGYKNVTYLKLLHSRFTFNDRKRLEDEIVGTKDKSGTFANPKPTGEKKGKILVATQVVEASLDIDADVLYTELAPIDSLIQRMGRVLRRIKDNKTYKKYLEAKEPSDPNIFIFYQKPDDNVKLSSGAGSVYQNDLLAFSLELLLRKAKPKLISDSKIEELKKKYWQDGEGEKEKSKAKARDALKGFLEDLFKIIGNKRHCKSAMKKKVSVAQSGFVFPIRETDKKTFVETLYKVLPPESGYLQRFYETLDILDAGYMSDRKEQALRIFREIYTVPAIPRDRLDEFKQCIKHFLVLGNLNYTNFKIKVLCEYVVNIDIRKYLYNNSLNLQDASYLAYEIESGANEQINKIKNWLSGVYIFDGSYDSEMGVIEETKGKQDSEIVDI